MLSGKGPFVMLLDTGATHSVITERVAAALEARAIAKSTVISPTAAVIRPVVTVEEWSLGPITIDVVLPTVVADTSFDRESKIDGLIGQDVLRGLRYTIDFRRRLVLWHERTPAPHGIELTLSFDRGRFLVALPHEQATLNFVPDSGAGAIVLFEVAGRLPLEVRETGQTVELWSANAIAPARHVKIRELRIGSRKYRGVAAVAIPRPDHDPAEGDGLLPLHLFEQVTFDGPARRLFLG
jgi:predicted aspartyl protease